jgi:hypothetical protein
MMQAGEFIKYIEDPHKLDQQSVMKLRALVEDFPYFQSAHILLSLASRKWDSTTFQQSIGKTAIITGSRAHLFRLVKSMEDGTVVGPETDALQQTQKTDVTTPIHETETVTESTNILKHIEIAAEPVIDKEETPLVEPVVEAEQSKTAEEILEQEIEKQVVESFVEKKILKIPEVHQPKEKIISPSDFTGWLDFLKDHKASDAPKTSEKAENKALAKDETAAKDKKPQARKLRNMALIDKIIDANPGLIKNKETVKFYTPDVKAKESLAENEHLVTETLARIYALQGNINKAINAYEILSLKYPQKSAYFATLIKQLKEK